MGHDAGDSLRHILKDSAAGHCCAPDSLKTSSSSSQILGNALAPVGLYAT